MSKGIEVNISGTHGSIHWNIAEGIVNFHINDQKGRYEFKEDNNLYFALKYFKDGKSNLDTAIKITKILEGT